MNKPVVAFVCTHNSCRSQIAEALAYKYANDAFEAYSAGTHPVERINPDAKRLLETEYKVDTNALYPKCLTDIPAPDIVITMGCGVQCPVLPCSHREDWGLADPTCKSDAEFLATMREIKRRVLDLRQRIEVGSL